MPPTYSPFWKPFEALARFGAGKRKVSPGNLVIGAPYELDALGSPDVARFRDPATLYRTWGPPDASPWSAFHRPTLFAALDGIRPENANPTHPGGFEVATAPRHAPSWVDMRTAVMLELPGAVSVAYAAWLARAAKLQPVATFNNWPHASELVDASRVLGALLYYASWVHEAWDGIEGVTPPALMLDANRLGARPPHPLDFDNRYYLLDSDLPTAAMLAKAGIERVAYVHPPRRPDAPPDAWDDMDDTNPYLVEIAKRMPVYTVPAQLDTWGLGEPTKYEPRVRKTPFTTVKDPAFRGFRRNAAGGFGVLVPEPSSGGG